MKNILLKCRFPRLILIIPVLLCTLNAFSQDQPTCAEKLQTAQTLFERGQVEQVSVLIRECLESGFNREESLEAYKLIIQTFLFNEKFEQADSAMFAFLRKYPEYEVSPTDHSSFVGLFNNFSSKVVIQFSLHIGTNMPFVFISKEESLFGVPGVKKYTSKAANFFVSLEAKYKLTDKIELNAEAGYSQFAFSNSEKVTFAQGKFKEVHRRIELPLTVTYDLFRWGNFIPYARLGAGPALNINSYGIGEFDPNDKNNPFRRTSENIKDLPRIIVDVSALAGAGMKYKVREGFICAEIRSNIGLLNQYKSKPFSGENLEKEFFYMLAEDYFKLNTLNFSLGYTRIFYKPVRREEKK